MVDYKGVLNLIINGIPSILHLAGFPAAVTLVLNLIINGIPSILVEIEVEGQVVKKF